MEKSITDIVGEAISKIAKDRNIDEYCVTWH
jgi:hypothetical protein